VCEYAQLPAGAFLVYKTPRRPQGLEIKEDAMRRLGWIIVLAWGTVLVLGSSLCAQEDGLLERINPFRLSRNRNVEPLATHSQLEKSPQALSQRGINPVATDSWLSPRNSLTYREQHRNGRETLPDSSAGPQEIGQLGREVGEDHRQGGWFAQRTAEGNPPTIEEMRQHLLSRGVDPQIVERQMERLSVARGGVEGQSDLSARQRELARVRMEMEARGLDPRGTERSLETAARTRAFSQRFEQRRQANGAPNYEQLRTRVSGNAEDPRTMNTRLGRSQTVVGGVDKAARYGHSRIR
jgi:hypothetical protein